MLKIIKIFFYLSVLTFLLPVPPDTKGEKTQAFGQQAGSVLTAGVTMFNDVSGVCLRHPEVCQVVSHLLLGMEQRVKYSIRLVYEWANPQYVPTQRDGSPPEKRAFVPRQDRLNSADLQPEWGRSLPVAKQEEEEKTSQRLSAN